MDFMWQLLLVAFFVGTLYLLFFKPDVFLKLWNAQYDPEREREKQRQQHERKMADRQAARGAARIVGKWLGM